jgi:hypothetical protein
MLFLSCDIGSGATMHALGGGNLCRIHNSGDLEHMAIGKYWVLDQRPFEKVIHY